MDIPVKLEVLVQERYQGNWDKLQDAAQQMQGYLCELETKKLKGSRWQYHNLRAEWPAERYKEFDDLTKGLLDSTLNLSAIKRGIIYKDSANDLHGISLHLPALVGSVAGVGIAFSGAYFGVGGVIGASVGTLIGGAALFGLELAISGNPFEKVGCDLVSQASIWHSMNEVELLRGRMKGLKEKQVTS